jgi:hypothetical protein
MIRNALFFLGALLIIIWIGATMQLFTTERPALHILLAAGVLSIVAGCILHMRVTQRVGEIEEKKSKDPGREHFR